MRVISVFVAVLLIACCIPALAQGSGNCTVTGTVYDSSGAVVPNAKIQLVAQATNTSRDTTANGSGFFSFTGIAAGTYDVRVNLAGFVPFVQKDLVLHINDQVVLRQVVLKVEAAGTNVEVTAEASEIIPTSSGETSYTLTNKQVDNLAVIGRNAVELVKIMPGAQNSGGWNGQYDGQTAAFNSGAGAYTVNGTRFDQMSVVSDGGSVIDPGFMGGAAVTPNVEMVQEVKVETGSYAAENPNGPIVMSTITKSGGKSFHGEGYYSVRDSSMNASDPYQHSQNVAKPASRYQYPGFQLGGPVLVPGTDFNRNRDKLFFFSAFEWMRQGVDLGVHRTFVPTEAMRNGDFSEFTANNAMIAKNPICQNAEWYCAAPGVIAPAYFDAGGQALMNLYPMPNTTPSDATQGNNYITDIVNPQNRNQQLVKIDYNVNTNTQLSGRYNHEHETIPFPYGLWQTWPQNTYPGDVVGENASHSLALSLTHAFSPTLTNEFNFTSSRLFYGNALSNPAAVSASKVGYPYYGVYDNGLDVIPNVGGDVVSTGVANFFNEGGVIPNQNSPKWTFTLSENVSKAVGTHLLKAGFYWSRLTWQQRTGDNSYLDQGAITLASWNSVTGNPYADLMMGHASMFSQGKKSLLLDFAANEYDFFVQDNWKVSRKLTLNFGARLNHIGWWYNKQGDIAVFDPARYDATAPVNAYTGIVTHASDPAVSNSGYDPVGIQFAPAFGFAWDITGSGKTVIRGGAGVNYFRDEAISAAFKLVQNAPLQSMDFFTWDPIANSSGVYLKNLSSLPASNALPWLNVALQNEGKMPRTYSYNLTLQRQIAGRTILSAAYVGNSSQHLVGWPDANPIAEGSPEMGQNWPGDWMDTSLAHRAYQNIAGIYPAAHALRSNYNSFQFTASRNQGAINYWITYTFSKGLGNQWADSFDQARSYGVLPWDRTHSLKLAYNVTLPNFGTRYLGNNPVVNGITNGWQVSGITEFTSGAPVFSVGSSFPGAYNLSMIWNELDPNFNTGQRDLSSRYIVGTPDGHVVPKVVCDPTANLADHQVFNAACFQSPAIGDNGNYQIPYIHGPWYNNSDLSIFKNFNIGESRKLQFRAEAFNFLNHPLWNFVPNGTSYNDAGLNLVYSQYGATPTNASTAGFMTNKFGHRIVQLALKFYF